MSQKIAIIFVILLIAVIGVGLWFYTRSEAGVKQSIVNNNQSSVPANQPAGTAGQTAAPATPANQNNAARKAELEEMIAKAIPEKLQRVDKASIGRPFNDDELDFIGNPRRNIINELVKKGKITPADKQLLIK
ncbi:MAG: hypothetical protein WCO55_04155 [Candidatus Falkowbacteria bacterium]